MLVITLKPGESIYIDDDTIITLIEKWTDEVALRVATDRVITIDDAESNKSN
jgi:sRNA-binding carbon storage regulator CsrA